MERKIGEIFEHNGEWYQCLENSSCRCDYCDFGELSSCDTIACLSSERKDGKEVHFKKLEKVGEPYELFVKNRGIILLQKYKMLVEPYINGVFCNIHYEDNTIDIEIKQNKEDMEDLDKIKVRDYTKVEELNVMEENKLNLKPFDIQKAREGKPVCTRDGRKARIICFDRIDSTGCNLTIVALIQVDETEVLQLYHDNGKCNAKANLDLMMLPEKKEGWVNVYKDGLLDTKSYPTKKEAFDKASPKDYVDTIKINWSE